MELRPIRELKTAEAKREADHLSDLNVKDSSMICLIDDDGLELVTLTPWTYARIASKVGQVNVFNSNYRADTKSENAKRG